MISANLPTCCPVSKTAKHVRQKRQILCKVWNSPKIPMDSPLVKGKQHFTVLGLNEDEEITQIHISVQNMQGEGQQAPRNESVNTKKLR